MFGKKIAGDEFIEVHDGNVVHRLVVKRSARKSISLSIKSDGTPAVHCPKLTLKSTLKKVAIANIAWISTKVEQVRAKGEKVRATYEYGTTVLFMGENIVLYTAQLHQKEEVLLESDGLYIKASNPIDVRLSIKSFYRSQARALFVERTKYWISEIDFAREDTKILIKTMATRWGSMSSTGRMNLNIALMRTPIECIDYVIVHELCHQKHPHHQSPFWAEVEGIMPDYKQWEKVLKSYGTQDL